MNIIFRYTADQAMADGYLFDVSTIARQAGFVYPVRITVGVKDLLTPDENAQSAGQSYDGRLWDVLFVARQAILQSKDDKYISFKVIFQDSSGTSKNIKLFAALDATSGPAIHIGLPSEY